MSSTEEVEYVSSSEEEEKDAAPTKRLRSFAKELYRKRRRVQQREMDEIMGPLQRILTENQKAIYERLEKGERVTDDGDELSIFVKTLNPRIKGERMLMGKGENEAWMEMLNEELVEETDMSIRVVDGDLYVQLAGEYMD